MLQSWLFSSHCCSIIQENNCKKQNKYCDRDRVTKGALEQKQTNISSTSKSSNSNWRHYWCQYEDVDKDGSANVFGRFTSCFFFPHTYMYNKRDMHNGWVTKNHFHQKWTKVISCEYCITSYQLVAEVAAGRRHSRIFCLHLPANSAGRRDLSTACFVQTSSLILTAWESQHKMWKS